jgi:hypothetical protein
MNRSLPFAFLLLLLPLPAIGQDHKASRIDMPVAVGDVSPEIAALLQPTGVKVAKGNTSTVEIWLAKEWPIAADAKTGGEILYSFTPGQLIGVARFPRKASDFREQDIPAGLYVIRYAHQPVDGAHVGTSPTRDFFALLPAAKDKDPKTLDYKTLITISKETTGTAHPAILSLQKPAGSGEALAAREESEKMWTIVRFVGKARQGAGTKDMPVELVVVGKAME